MSRAEHRFQLSDPEPGKGMRIGSPWWLGTFLFGLILVGDAGAVSFSDQTFNLQTDWTQYDCLHPVNSFDISQSATGGNPGAYVKIGDQIQSNVQAVRFFFRNGAIYDFSSPTQGDLKTGELFFSADVLHSADVTHEFYVTGAIRQGTKVYTRGVMYVAGGGLGWQHERTPKDNTDGNLHFSEFNLETCHDDPNSRPNFSPEAEPIQLGFMVYAVNYGTSVLTLNAGVDNWLMGVDPRLYDYAFDNQGIPNVAQSWGAITGVNGDITGASFGADVPDKSVSPNFSLSFNGSGNHVTVPYQPHDYGSTTTVEAWIKPAAVDGQRMTWDDFGTTGVQLALSNGSAQFCVSTAAHPGIVTCAYGGNICTGSWQHVAGTYDGSFVRVYVNGVELSKVPASGTVLVNSGQQATLGSDNQDTTIANYAGLLDEVRIWDAALAPGDLGGGTIGRDKEPCSGTSNQRPIAVATVSRNEWPVGADIVLDGTGSSDPDGPTVPLTYAWTKIEGPDGVWTDPDKATAHFRPTAIGIINLQLVVTDEHSAHSVPVFLKLRIANSVIMVPESIDFGTGPSVSPITGDVNPITARVINLLPQTSVSIAQFQLDRGHGSPFEVKTTSDPADCSQKSRLSPSEQCSITLSFKGSDNIENGGTSDTARSSYTFDDGSTRFSPLTITIYTYVQRGLSLLDFCGQWCVDNGHQSWDEGCTVDQLLCRICEFTYNISRTPRGRYSSFINQPNGNTTARSAVLLPLSVNMADLKQTFRDVRDKLLAATPEGQRYVRLYNTHTAEIVSLVQADADLMDKGANMLLAVQPLFRDLLDGKGAAAVITAEQTQAIDAFLDALSTAGSPALQAAIAAERTRWGNLDDYMGKTMNQARDSVLGNGVFLPNLTKP